MARGYTNEQLDDIYRNGGHPNLSEDEQRLWDELIYIYRDNCVRKAEFEELSAEYAEANMIIYNAAKKFSKLFNLKIGKCTPFKHRVYVPIA